MVRRTYDAAEVATLVGQAYESGRADRYAEDLAEMHGSWQEHAEPRPTYAARVAARIREMEAYAEGLTWYRWRGYYPGGPVDFDTGELATPASQGSTKGAPLTTRELQERKGAREQVYRGSAPLRGAPA